MDAGDLYVVDDEITALHLRAATLTEAFNATPAAQPARRRKILDELLGAVGPHADVRAPLHCDYGVNLRIGARTFVNFGLVALDVAPITIGDDVQIGPECPTAHRHPSPRQRAAAAKWESAQPITIGDNAWLGGGAIVLPGVTIGEDAVVGAGAVVTRHVAARCRRRGQSGPGRCRRIGRRRRSGPVSRLRSAGADQRRVEAHPHAPAVQLGRSPGGDRAQAAGGLDESGRGEDLPTEVGRLERRTPNRFVGPPQIAQGEAAPGPVGGRGPTARDLPAAARRRARR